MNLRLGQYAAAVLIAIVLMAAAHGSAQETAEEDTTAQEPVERKPQYTRLSSPEALKAYLAWTRGRTPMVAAYRGGPEPGFPENCIETFHNSLTYGPCIIHCDVRKTADGELILMRDPTLERTTTGKGRVDELKFSKISSFKLKDDEGEKTDYKVPTLKEAVEWAEGKAVLLLDVKKEVRNWELVKALKEMEASTNTVVIVTDVYTARYMKLHLPRLALAVSVKQPVDLEDYLINDIPPADLVALVGTAPPEPEIYRYLHRKRIKAILATMRSVDKVAESDSLETYGAYLELYNSGADILLTSKVPLVFEAINRGD